MSKQNLDNLAITCSPCDLRRNALCVWHNRELRVVHPVAHREVYRVDNDRIQRQKGSTVRDMVTKAVYWIGHNAKVSALVVDVQLDE